MATRPDNRVIRYGSWRHVADTLQSPDPAYYGNGKQPSATNKPASHDWDYNAGWNGTLKMAGAEGWPEGSERIKRYTDRYIAQLASKVKLPTYYPEVVGDFYDVGLLMSGEPEHWLQREDSDQSTAAAGRVYRVVLNISASWNVPPETIERRGAAAAALVQLLELAGLTTELTVVFAVKKDQARMTAEINLKSASEPLDLDRLALVAIHPAGLRRIGFRLMEIDATDNERDYYEYYSSGLYGYPCNVGEDEQGDVYSPSISSASPTPFSADKTTLAWIKEQLTRLGAMGEGA